MWPSAAGVQNLSESSEQNRSDSTTRSFDLVIRMSLPRPIEAQLGMIGTDRLLMRKMVRLLHQSLARNPADSCDRSPTSLIAPWPIRLDLLGLIHRKLEGSGQWLPDQTVEWSNFFWVVLVSACNIKYR